MQSHEYGASTHIGNARENNEDTYVCAADKELWIVADGMGGLGFGEAASAITAYTVTTLVKQGHGINQAIGATHKKIKEYAETEAQGTNMGTTLVLLLSQGNVYNLFWVGDSRGYLFNGKLKQITRDHSLVQALIDQGELTEEEAQFDPRKNAITKALGVRELETVRADTVSDRWRPGDKILLCSDGLSDCVAQKDIEAILGGDGTDQELVQRLIDRALAGGGRDNITVVLVSAPANVSAGDSDTEVPDDVPAQAEAPDPSLRDDSDTNVRGRRRSQFADSPTFNATVTRPTENPTHVVIEDSPPQPADAEADTASPLAATLRTVPEEAGPAPAGETMDIALTPSRSAGLRVPLKYLVPVGGVLLLLVLWAALP